MEVSGFFVMCAPIDEKRQADVKKLLDGLARDGLLDTLTLVGSNPMSMPTFAGPAETAGASKSAAITPPQATKADRSSSGAGQPRKFAGALEVVRQNVCVIRTPAGHGSGFVVAPWRLIVTNNHVVEGYDDILVTFSDGIEQAGVVVARDERRDLAVIRTSVPQQYKGLHVKPTSEVLIGEEAYAIGAPVDADGLGWTLTRGIVSQIRNGETSWIQMDTAVNPGNSGGPLTDKDGVVLGVVVTKLTGDSLEGIAFAVAGDELNSFLGNLE